MQNEKTMCCISLNDPCTGTRAFTPDSVDDPGVDPEQHEHPPLDAPESLPEPDEQGRQRATAAVRTMHPPAFLARISDPISTQNTSAFIKDIRRLYVVPVGDQAPGVESDEYRVGLKRKVADISR